MYQGAFHHDVIAGQGTFTFVDGRLYVGEWAAGKKVKGTFTWPHGDKYTGSFLNDLRHGDGMMLLICMYASVALISLLISA